MKFLTVVALLPALAMAIPTEQQIEVRQAQSPSTTVVTKTVTATTTATATKTVYSCVPSSSTKSTTSTTATSSATSKSASSVTPTSPSSKFTTSSTAKSSSTTTTSATTTSKSTTSATSTSPSAATSSSGVSAADRDQFLQLHNDFRKQYGANAITWDTTLADYALKSAQTCKYGHTGGPYGENIAAGAGGGYNIQSAFTAWGPNEATKYDYNNPGFSSATGHFTQVVWKSTTKIGCAAVTCPDGSIFKGYGPSLYVVCEYAPPGNIVGNNNQYFRDNVGQKVA